MKYHLSILVDSFYVLLSTIYACQNFACFCQTWNLLFNPRVRIEEKSVRSTILEGILHKGEGEDE